LSVFRDYKIIKDPLHGYIKVFPHERCIVDSPPFQRLRRLKQLPAAQYVYPGAVHTRFTHSLGVMHVAGLFAEHLYSKLGIDRAELERLVAIARLLGLLHDIGHGPFSHTFEDHVLSKYGTNHEIVGGRLVREHQDLSSCFDRIEKELGVSAKAMGGMIEAPSAEVWPLTSRVSGGVTERSLYYIIKGAYSADLIDYILRDSLYTGANYGLGLDWVRLAYNSRLVKDRVVLEYKAKDVLDHLLIARLYMFKTVYFHKTARAFDKVIGDLLERADPVVNFGEAVDDLNKYVNLDDESVLGHPEVRALSEANYLLNRVVPYKMVYESLQPIEGSLSTLIGFAKDVIETTLVGRLRASGADVGDSAVFIDTPKLPTNPMFEETEVDLVMPDGVLVSRPVRDTTAGLMPKEIAFFRVYLHTKYSKYLELARTVATSIFKGRELRSFY